MAYLETARNRSQFLEPPDQCVDYYHACSIANSDQVPLFQPFQSAANFFGDQLSITGSVNLPPGEVLYYTSSATSQSQYLEGFSYDKFDGHTWTSSASNENQQFPAGAQLPV